MVNTLYDRGSYSYAQKQLYLDLNKRETPPTCTTIKKPPILELKAVLSHF